MSVAPGAAPLPVTGILLVGGASSRFGSPKALARLVDPAGPAGGETLAERAWRTLAAACAEALAVGKAADALPLPFPLVDDGPAEVRAPIAGVVAGLRAARHDVCVVLPVDCPLVDAATVRQLAAALAETGPESVAAAHPSSGLIPGAFRRSIALPLLEAALGAGQFSIWRALDGAAHALVDVDESLLADADDPATLAEMQLRISART